MVADPLPPPLQPPEVVIATSSPELAVAATVKPVLYVALAGAEVVTVIVWVIVWLFALTVRVCGTLVAAL
jgi:hypothetical protein